MVASIHRCSSFELSQFVQPVLQNGTDDEPVVPEFRQKTAWHILCTKGNIADLPDGICHNFLAAVSAEILEQPRLNSKQEDLPCVS